MSSGNSVTRRGALKLLVGALFGASAVKSALPAATAQESAPFSMVNSWNAEWSYPPGTFKFVRARVVGVDPAESWRTTVYEFQVEQFWRGASPTVPIILEQ